MSRSLLFISPEVVATWARLLGNVTCSRCQMYDDCIVLHDCVLSVADVARGCSAHGQNIVSSIHKYERAIYVHNYKLMLGIRMYLNILKLYIYFHNFMFCQAYVIVYVRSPI